MTFYTFLEVETAGDRKNLRLYFFVSSLDFATVYVRHGPYLSLQSNNALIVLLYIRESVDDFHINEVV